MDWVTFLETMNLELIDVTFILKLLFLFGLLLYLVYAFVVIRQVEMMIHSLPGSVFEFPLRIAVWAHFLLTIAVIALVIVV